jgi:hypothetical protein
MPCESCAGLNGLTFPSTFNTSQPSFMLIRARLDDLIDRDFWENWAAECLASYA